MNRVLRHFGLFAVLGLAVSCTELDLNNMGNVNYSPSLVLPIGSMRASVSELVSSVDSANIKVDEEQKMFYFEFSMPMDTVATVDLDNYDRGSKLKKELILSETEGGSEIFDILPPYLNELQLPASDYTFSTTEKYPFDYNETILGEKEYRIDSCHLSTATLNLGIEVEGINVSEENYLDIELVFPSIQYDEDALRLSGRMTSSSGELKDVYTNFPLNFEDGDDKNEVDMEVHYTLHSNGTAVITRDAAIRFTTQFDFIGFDDLFGFFYDRNALTAEEIVADIPENSILDSYMEGNKFLIHNPVFTFMLYSNVGIPFTVEVADVKAEDKQGNVVYADFEGSRTMSVELEMPELTPGGELIPSVTEIVLDRENAGTNELFSIFPHKFYYNWAVYAKNNDRSMAHFVTESPYVMAEATVRLPFVFDAGTVFHYDTVMDADMSGLLPSDSVPVEALNVYLDVANSTPLAMELQLDFLNEQNEVVFRGESVKIDAAQVDEKGRAVAAAVKKIEVKCKGETINKILTAKRIGLNTSISGKDEHSGIYLQTTDSLSVDVSAFVKLNATVNVNDILGQ